ncbi:MAG: ribonuclease HII [Ruminococcus sp.]|nr:ribonuclease HII [Ruminococcus sp.]
MAKESTSKKSTHELYEFDAEKRKVYPVLCGVDEAGRGPLAGDVYAAAVILDPDCIIDGINDSKKLTEKKRELLFEEICENAESYCIATATIAEIEELNILGAAMLAMRRAVEGLEKMPSYVLVDGNRMPKLPVDAETVIKGDANSASIAAASILAKVARDKKLRELDEIYPEYGFAKHKGYGTKAHYEAILKYGPCPVHRMSFLKKLYKE